MRGIEPRTPFLPRKCSATELHRQPACADKSGHVKRGGQGGSRTHRGNMASGFTDRPRSLRDYLPFLRASGGT